MRIIHTSDLHLDSPLTTRLDSNKVKERKGELLLSFKRLAEMAEAEGAEAFIIAGDLFDSERIGKRTLKNTLDIISAHPKVTFLYLAGNHEKTALTRSMLPLPENIRIFESEWSSFAVGGVNFIGRTETAPNMFESIPTDKESINVVILHGEIRDRSDFGGVIGKGELAGRSIDYLALGHYHSYAETDIDPTHRAVYSGTPEGRGFDEYGKKGCVIIDINGRVVSHRFAETAYRTLYVKEIDVSDADSDIAAVYKIEKELYGVKRGDLVRVKLVGTRKLGRSFDTDTMLSSFSSAYYYAEIKDETRLLISADDFKNDISLKGEFIRSVIEDDTLSDKEKEAVINLGLNVLMEEVKK